MPNHVLRLWLLVSLATLLAGVLLAPRSGRASDGLAHAESATVSAQCTEARLPNTVDHHCGDA